MGTTRTMTQIGSKRREEGAKLFGNSDEKPIKSIRERHRMTAERSRKPGCSSAACDVCGSSQISGLKSTRESALTTERVPQIVGSTVGRSGRIHANILTLRGVPSRF